MDNFDLIDTLCTVERGTCAICSPFHAPYRTTDVIRISTDDLSDPAFCRRCLIAMRKMLDDDRN